MKLNIDKMIEHSTDIEEVFERLMANDPVAQAEWERTAFARAVSIEVLKYRAANGLSQTTLAKKLGVSQPLIARLELGEHEPKVSTLQKLSGILGLTFTITIHPNPDADSTTSHVELAVSA